MAEIAPDLVNPHLAAPECGGMHCWSHGVDEPRGGAYLACFECGHVYRTAEDLRAAFMAEVAPDLQRHGVDPGPPPAEEIFACPFCIHDF